MIAIAAVVAAVVTCLGMMGWFLGTWNAETEVVRERKASDAVSLAIFDAGRGGEGREGMM